MSPYISAEEVARAVEEEERRRREAEANKDDAPQRALQDMMGGTLEAKDEVTLLREKLVKPPWMDAIPEAKYNAEQREYAAERAAAALALEEVLERRKVELGAEVVRLAGEVRDTVCAFDERLGALGAHTRSRSLMTSTLPSARAAPRPDTVPAAPPRQQGPPACPPVSPPVSPGFLADSNPKNPVIVVIVGIFHVFYGEKILQQV
jgi:hypothetical protein